MAYYHNKEPVDTSQRFDHFKYTVDGFSKFREEYYQTIQKRQEHRVIRTRRKELYSESSTFPEAEFVWNDLDPRFRFFMSHIPILDVRDTIKVRVTSFKGIDDIRCQLMGKEVRHFREIIDNGLKEYCSTAAVDPNFRPVPGQIFFVLAQPLAIPEAELEVQYHSKTKFRAGWLTEDSDDDKDDKQSRDPIWMRAECQEYDAATNQTTVYFIDTGKTVKYNLSSDQIRKAVFRHLAWPALSVNIMIALEKPVQFTLALSEKWQKLIPNGMKLLLKLCGVCNGRYMTRLISPTENELEFLYISKRLHGGKGDTTNGSIRDPAIPWKYAVELGVHTLQSPKDDQDTDTQESESPSISSSEEEQEIE